MASINLLDGIHPDLVKKVGQIQQVMSVLDEPMVVVAGRRTAAQQLALYQQGRTKPGNIVTNADGELKKSNHQVKPDGWGHAVDMAFLDDAGNPSWSEKKPWRLYGEVAKHLGLKWGGDWHSIVDRPHIELPCDCGE